MYMCIYLGIFRINPIVNLLPRISLPNFYILMDLLQPVSVVRTFYYLLKTVLIVSKKDYENISVVMLMTVHDVSLNTDISN